MSDKLDKSIKNNMLDDFLSDGDKPKPPAPAKTNYGGGYNYNSDYSYGTRRSQPSLWDDDGPDPMDDDYYDSRKPRGRLNKKDDDDEGTGRTSSVFPKRKHNNTVADSVGGDYPRQIAAVIRTLSIDGGLVVMETGERDEIVNLMMKMIGVGLDKAGITWSTTGVTALRETLKDLLPMTFVNGKKVVIDDDGEETYDPDTGEITGRRSAWDGEE